MRKATKKTQENNVEEDKVDETNDSSDIEKNGTDKNGLSENTEEEMSTNNKTNNKRKSTADKEVDEPEKHQEKSNKKQKKAKGKKEISTPEKPEESEKEYEVEKIVGHRTIKGRRQFKVHWVGYADEEDTWENEKELNCQRLIDEYLAQENEEPAADETTPANLKKPSPSKKGKKNVSKKALASKKQAMTNDKDKHKDKTNDVAEDESQEDGDKKDKEYEVEKILEVRFKKDKTRDFLIRWKGFKSAYDSWEPEENLNCRRLIESFMEKVDEKKQYDTKELRVNPSHTKRFTLTMHADKRQSRRNANKERPTYHED